MLSKSQQQAYDATIHEAVRLVQARTFVRCGDLAEYFHKTKNWPNQIKREAVQRGLITPQEWDNSFTGKFAKRYRWKCSACGHSGKLVRVERA